MTTTTLDEAAILVAATSRARTKYHWLERDDIEAECWQLLPRAIERAANWKGEEASPGAIVHILDLMVRDRLRTRLRLRRRREIPMPLFGFRAKPNGRTVESILAEWCGNLDPRAMEIARMRWIDGKRQSQIARALGLSQSRISQIVQEIRATIARRIGGDPLAKDSGRKGPIKGGRRQRKGAFCA